jgi:hypothetical protein
MHNAFQHGELIEKVNMDLLSKLILDDNFLKGNVDISWFPVSGFKVNFLISRFLIFLYNYFSKLVFYYIIEIHCAALQVKS